MLGWKEADLQLWPLAEESECKRERGGMNCSLIHFALSFALDSTGQEKR